jgi:hypothetical protein
LVVDVGVGPPEKPDEMTDEEAQLHHELLVLIQKCMPADKKSPYASFLPGFTSLRLLLVQQTRSTREEELLKSILAAYSTYKKSVQRSETDIAVSTARDFMLLSKHWNNRSMSQQAQKLSIASSHPQLQQNTIMNQSVPPTTMFRTRMKSSSTHNSQQGIVHVSVPFLQNRYNNKDNIDVGSVQDALLLNTFSMSGHGHDFTGTSSGVSPALHPITGSPAFGSHSNFASLGNSPTLQPIPTQQGGTVSDLATLGISASPISDMLQNDGSTHFQEL